MSAIHPRHEPPIPCGFVPKDDPLLALANPAVDARIAVVNPGALELACKLIRRGYTSASIVCLDDGAPAHQADIVLVPSPTSLAFVERVIPFARRILTSCGVVILRIPSGRTAGVLERADRLLAVLGFTAIQHIRLAHQNYILAESPTQRRVSCA